jgi:Ca2+-binding RTX toxin-like protein
VLHGGDGDDILAGDRGADLLYGEAGNDTFVIGLNDSAVDTIFDHSGSNFVALDGVGDETVEAAIVGDDLHLIVAKNPIAIVDDYVGHEDAIAGVRFGGDVFAVDDLLASVGPASDLVTPEPEPTTYDPADQDVLASYLDRPSHQGTTGDDHFDGSNGSDWLTGLAGADHLEGRGGSDVLEGGDGTDLLEGGAGDDRYLFTSGETGIDKINDAEGANVAELHGFTGAKMQGVVVGSDLFVVANYGHVFTVENYAGNEAAFAGVQVDDTFVATEELFG